MRKTLLTLACLFISMCNAQTVASKENKVKSNETIINEIFSKNISKDYEFEIIEIEKTGKFNFNNLKKEYEVPEIFIDKIEENKKTFNYIQALSKQKQIDSYISVIIGTRLKNSDEEIYPGWYLLFLDAKRNVVDMLNYHP